MVTLSFNTISYFSPGLLKPFLVDFLYEHILLSVLLDKESYQTLSSFFFFASLVVLHGVQLRTQLIMAGLVYLLYQ